MYGIQSVMIRGKINAYFLVEYRWLFLTLDKINNLCLVYWNFCANEMIFKLINDRLQDLKHYFIDVEIWMNLAQNINRIRSQEKSVVLFLMTIGFNP